MTFRPMLAATAPEDYRLTNHVLASRKLDGVRATIINGVAMSRSGKPIPNRALQAAVAARPWMEAMDGEFICGPANATDVYRRTTSAVMTIEGTTDDLAFHVFDWYCPGVGFDVRYATAKGLVQQHNDPMVQLVDHRLILTHDELDDYETEALELGYEGVMLRCPYSLYKNGRSTVKEGGLLKVKRFVDYEYLIVGAEELMVNTNEQERDELGYAKRSTSKDGLVPGGTLGALRCSDGHVEFGVGSGFAADERARLWALHATGELVGKHAKVKSFPVGVKEAPRFPVYLGLRDPIDMGE